MTIEKYGFDQLLDAMAQNAEVVRAYLESTANVRDPLVTDMLDDLEREYGLILNEVLTDAERRQILAAVKGAKPSTGSWQQLQDKLHAAGFTDLFVRENNGPMIDPSLFVGEQYKAWCGNPDSCCGNQEAYCGAHGGELVVNGDQYINEVAYLVYCGEPDTCCGNENALCGRFDGMRTELIGYDLPPVGVRWNFIFYIGGEVTTWDDPPVFERAQVPNEKRDILRALILQFKPLHSWAGLNVDFV